MNKKKKLYLVVIMPAVSTVVVTGLLSFVLITGMSAGAARTADALNGASPVQVASAGIAEGAPGAVPGSPGEDAPAASGEADEAPVPVTDMPACDFSDWVGKPVDQAALDATKRPYRVMKPGDAATMDYSAARINVVTDPDTGTVTDVHCG